MHKTHDYIYHFHGYWRPGGVCRIEIFQDDERHPVILCGELPQNDNTSITNMVEYLAAEVVRAHFPQLFDAVEEPFVWLERYPREPWEGRPAAYARVTFDSYTPRQVLRAGGVRRVILGRPHWRHISYAEVMKLIGAPVRSQRRSVSRSNPDEVTPA